MALIRNILAPPGGARLAPAMRPWRAPRSWGGGIGVGIMSDRSDAARAEWKSKAAPAAGAADPKRAAVSVPGGGADGSPLDNITYLEAKLILKPDSFTSAKALRDFGKVVDNTAAAMNIGLRQSLDYYLSPKIREIVFADTPDFALYGAGFILRRRIAYRQGFPFGNPEFVLKFRHPEFERAAALDVRFKTEGKYRIKFKAELLPLRDRAGGARVLYSHNCQFGLGPAARAEWMAIERLTEAFPVLKSLELKAERMSLVNEGIVEEVLLPIGVLDFGGLTANCDVSLWRTRGEHYPLVGEFAFQAKFPSLAALAAEPRARCEAFYTALQHAVEDGLALGVTKTAMVYRLNGMAPPSYE